MVLVLSLSLVACGESEPKLVKMTFGNITLSAPDVLGAVEEREGVYVSSGPNSSLSVIPAMEIDLLPTDWDESFAGEAIELLYSATYSDIEQVTFQGDLDLNGNTAVYIAFNGTNASGEKRLVHTVRLFNSDITEQYMISLIHAVDDKLFTDEMNSQIINSIALGE